MLREQGARGAERFGGAGSGTVVEDWTVRGVRVALGLDEAGINDDRDMLQEMRLVLRLHRVPGMDDAVPTCPQVLKIATEDGAATASGG